MNKIGIMSMQRISNYGSFMQSYFLSETLEEIFKDEIGFVDYRVEKPIVESKSIDKLNYSSFLEKLHVKYIGFKYKMLNKYIWLPKYLNVKKINYAKPQNLIIGSDEVFNCTQSSPKVGFSRELFGKGFENSNVISYAASFGFTTEERLLKYNIYDEVQELLKNFKAISVRDDNSKEIVTKLTGNSPEKNVDPVVIGDIERYVKGKVKYKKYVILYAYSARISPEEANDIKKYAKVKGYKIISIGAYQKCADANLVIDPFKVLNYFKNAECIITDTFHGTIFSAKFHKKFITLVRETNKNKLGDLLKTLKLESREVKNFKNIEKMMEKTIDYTRFDEVVDSERKKTYMYLKENIII